MVRFTDEFIKKVLDFCLKSYGNLVLQELHREHYEDLEKIKSLIKSKDFSGSNFHYIRFENENMNFASFLCTAVEKTEFVQCDLYLARFESAYPLKLAVRL